MSMEEENRPLTRRELRLREMAAEEAQKRAQPSSSDPAPAQEAPAEDQIYIAPVDADGTPRTRRQIRELREQAIAEREAARREESPAEPEVPEAALEAPEEAEETPELPAESTSAPTPEAEPVDIPTQPFSLVDVKEAEQARAAADGEDEGEDEAPSLDDLLADSERSVADAGAQSDDADEVETPEDEGSEPTPAPKRGIRLPWRRVADEDAAEPEAPVTDAAPATEEILTALTSESARRPDIGDDAVTEVLEEVPSESTDALPDALEETDDRPLDVVEEERAVDEIDGRDVPEEPSGGDEATPAETPGYSFPNIEPPEEWRSVFDDPATRVVPSPPQESPTPASEGFDDLISRAVVQEGTTGGSGPSALILPSMPDDAGLNGPLGGTGELFVTGSIEVPKSIGETGGHSALHDTVDYDPIDDLGLTLPAPDDRDSGPVSARSAVSAMSQTGVPPVSETRPDKSRLPLILSLTGGGLIVVVAGLVIWGASSGFFG